MFNKIQVDLKHLHDRHGCILDQNLIELLKENPTIFIKLVISYSSFHVKTNLTEKLVSKEGTFDTIYVESKDDEGNQYYHIDHTGLGNFGGPYLRTIDFLLDEETALYLKMKGII